MQQAKQQILIAYSESDQQYVAHVLDIPDCVGYGWNYVAALTAAEHALMKHLKGKNAQVQSTESTTRTNGSPLGAQARAMQILRRKYGKVTIAELCQRFGNGCKVQEFTAGMGGNGTRTTRVLIALAAELPPSELWPHRAYTTRRRDDEQYLKKKLDLPNNFATNKILELNARLTARA